MNRLRIRIRVAKGEHGVYLEKLENVLRETREFLKFMAEDLHVDPAVRWVGRDFRNQSLSYTAEYPTSVPHDKQVQFNSGIVGLLNQRREPFVRPVTAQHFYDIPRQLEGDEKLRIAVFPNGASNRKWFTIDRTLASAEMDAPTRTEYIGAANGVIHSWYKEVTEPYFYLRETLTEVLIKCFYKDEMYKRIANAVQKRNQIIHVHGLVRASVLNRRIEEIDVDNMITPEPFTVRDYMKFVHPQQH